MPLIFCIYFLKKINTKELKVFFVYSIFQALFAILCSLAIYAFKSFPSYILILRVHSVFEYFLISYFLYIVIRNSIVKKIILFLTIPYLILSIYDFYKYGNQAFSNDPSLVEFLVLILFIIFFLFEKMQYSIQVPVYQTINFWISVGLFVYFTGTFFYILLVKNTNNADIDLKKQLIIINSVVIIFKNIILGLSFLIKEDKSNDDNILNIASELDLDSFYPNNNLN